LRQSYRTVCGDVVDCLAPPDLNIAGSSGFTPGPDMVIHRGWHGPGPYCDPATADHSCQRKDFAYGGWFYLGGYGPFGGSRGFGGLGRW